jgi:uncharacterized protein YacL
LNYIDRSDFVALRVSFIVILGAIAAVFRPFALPPYIAAGLGSGCALIVVGIEMRLRRAALKPLVAGVIGMLIGSVLGILLMALVALSSLARSVNGSFLQLAVPLCASYIGLAVGLSKAELLNLNAIGLFNGEGASKHSVKILDTSVIIDGRIADIAESGFVDGTLVIPQFVLRELQLVADSADSMKRNRGRRGLDVVQRLQKTSQIEVQLVDDDPVNVREVDLKLIELAKIYRCRIVTNDFNLNKVAQVHGVDVLNINELANSLKPVVLPGESMRVFILKEGKEHNQGVAYLDDGTMVVVDNAKRQISRNVDIIVTSVLQTTAGKMIFGKFDERPSDRSSHPSSERHSPSPAPSQQMAAGAGAGKESQLV